MRRIAIGCAIVCLWSCGQQAEEQSTPQAERRAATTPQDAQAQAEWISARFVADAGGEGGIGAKEGPVRRRDEKIQRELETIDEDSIWGAYYKGDGLGWNVLLFIAPESGATYTWYGCHGTYDANHGSVVEVDGRTIRLDLAVNPKRNKTWSPAGPGYVSRYMSDEWCVVDWGDRRFMIPSSQMIPFCNDVNFGSRVDYPCRTVGDGEIQTGPYAYNYWVRPDEPPEVPNEYRLFLLAEPIRAAVLRTEEPTVVGKYYRGQPMYRVVADVNIGRSAGLLPGMTLRPWIGGGPEAEVLTIQDNIAQVRMHSSRPGKFLEPGSILTTGPRR